jgi:hypothetical protein
VWRTESVPPAPGQAPDLAIRADIEIPEQKISARWSLRRNDDSHTVEVMFTLPPDFPHGGITNIPGVLMKQSESTPGCPARRTRRQGHQQLLPAGLSSVDADRARNIQLLKEQAWFDIPVVRNVVGDLASGKGHHLDECRVGKEGALASEREIPSPLSSPRRKLIRGRCTASMTRRSRDIPNLCSFQT